MSDTFGTWQQWFDRHGAAMVLVARQYCPTLQDAEDAVQEGFVRFWKHRESARDAQAYLVTCVRRAALDQQRGQARRKQREEKGATSEAMFQPEQDLEIEERRTAVETALAKLPIEQREVVVMKLWGELTFAQAAEALGISANTAASRYRYALAALHNHLANETAR